MPKGINAYYARLWSLIDRNALDEMMDLLDRQEITEAEAEYIDTLERNQELALDKLSLHILD